MPLTFHRSHNSSLYAGTLFSLTCIITLNTTGVDSNFTLQSNFSIPRNTDTERVTISPPMFTGIVYEITVMFSPLIEDDTGAYNCSAVVIPISQQNSIIASDLSFGSESISVGCKQLIMYISIITVICYMWLVIPIRYLTFTIIIVFSN